MQRPVIHSGSRNRLVDVPVQEGPAAIRYHNPGAQWPNALAERYGMIGYGQLRDGNKIAHFPNPVYGAAANMALLAHNYTGMTIGDAQVKWSGQHRSSLPGWAGGDKITAQMMRVAGFVIPFMQSMADAEAPAGSKVLTPAQWRDAFDLYREIEGLPATAGGGPLPPVAPEESPKPTPGTKPQARPPGPPATFWDRLRQIFGLK